MVYRTCKFILGITCKVGFEIAFHLIIICWFSKLSPKTMKLGDYVRFLFIFIATDDDQTVACKVSNICYYYNCWWTKYTPVCP